MTLRREACGRSMGFLAVVLLLMGLAAWSDVPKLHGIELDERNRLEVQQISGSLTISLITRSRIPPNKPSTINGREVERMTGRKELIKVRSEVLIPSAPNYLCNPGDLYRITVDGVCFTPPYHSVREVKAGEALAYLYGEFVKLQGRLDGMQREAVRNAAGISLSVLNKAGYLPGQVATSVMKSKAGRERFGGEKLATRKTSIREQGWKTPQTEHGQPDIPGAPASLGDEKGTERK